MQWASVMTIPILCQMKMLHFPLSRDPLFSQTFFYLWISGEFSVLLPKYKVQFENHSLAAKYTVKYYLFTFTIVRLTGNCASLLLPSNNVLLHIVGLEKTKGQNCLVPASLNPLSVSLHDLWTAGGGDKRTRGLPRRWSPPGQQSGASCSQSGDNHTQTSLSSHSWTGLVRPVEIQVSPGSDASQGNPIIFSVLVGWVFSVLLCLIMLNLMASAALWNM